MINFKTTYLFTLPLRLFGYLFIVVGLIATVNRGVGFIILAVLGIYLSFSRYGVLFDIDNKRFKEYTSYLWMKTGTWKSISGYPYLTVLTITEKQSIRSLSNNSTVSREVVYRITMLSENHFEKIRLIQMSTKSEAAEECERLADLLGLEKVVYSPTKG